MSWGGWYQVGSYSYADRVYLIYKIRAKIQKIL